MKKPMVFEGVVAILVIVLLFAMYLMVAGGGAIKTNDWDIVANGQYENLHVGEDGTLYAFMGKTGNTIYAIGPDGNARWSVRVPEQWRVANPFNRPELDRDDGDWWSWRSYISPIFSVDNGTMYLYLRENRTTPWSYYPSEAGQEQAMIHFNYGAAPLKEEIMAISGNGDVLWEKQIGTDGYVYHDVSVKTENGRVYVFDDYNVTVLDGNGTALFKIPNVSDPPAVDEEGRIYVVSGSQPTWQTDIWPTNGYLMPSSTLRAYYPDGSLCWQENISMAAWRQDVSEGLRPEFGSLPVYRNHTLYVPVKNGIIALDVNGSTRWQKVYDWSVDCSLLSSMPMDSHGNVYLEYSRFHSTPSIEIIDPEGRDVANRSLDAGRIETYYFYAGGSMYDGSLYYANVTFEDLNDRYIPFSTQSTSPYVGVAGASSTMTPGNTTPGQACDIHLNAYGLLNDTRLWSSDVPIHGANTVKIDRDNAMKYLLPNVASTAAYYYRVNETPSETPSIQYGLVAEILPGRDLIYVSLYASTYDYPIVYSKSNCTYASELYAFSKNGTLVWEKPTDYFVTSMAANNSTIFFNTADGRLNMATINGVAGGITLLALVYVIVRFFLAGLVVRAKGRLDKNENRNGVLKYVADNPGSTLRDVSRGLRMNLGTARYHMFILELNHRVISYMADDKHVRYFTNSGSYSKEEQFIISLMRRDGVGKILKLLMEKPGLTNLELSSALGMQESAVSRYMKELSEKGVITREPAGRGRSLEESQREHVVAAMRRLYGE